mmetsp:Transcript_125895/g.228492  ORF Transcript_125895/g.228492 Transcript_125895/m.228492 type:complete len:225 (-) Transcript_125895:5724-6398(-)
MASRPRRTTIRALPPALRSSGFCTLYSNEMHGKRLHARATSMSCDCERPSRSLSRLSSSMFMTSKTSSTFIFLALSIKGCVKCGSCSSGLELEVVAWTIICESSMAKSAGVSQPQDEMTSTRPCSSLTAWSRMKRWSDAKSVVMGVRLKCALSSSWALVCGSVSLSFSTFMPKDCASPRRVASSPERTGTASNSEAAHKMSNRPRRLVFSFTVLEKVSMVVCLM